ncbi:MAG: acyl-phosphate glycerol 3-phosphate acyltransferase [Anaerolineaceae bacterium]|nr:acyl-phosphate glycerol 3-phosphate acyltransferase [Anaerolineaceae bacterium]
MTDQWQQIILVLVLSYVLGAIPTAYLIGRIKKINIFEVGSGNMGATNASRALGIGWGVLVWLLDMSKGIAAIFLARQIMTDAVAAATALAGAMSIIGHNWSIFVAVLTGKLRGGKGASVAFAALLVIAPGIVLGISLVGSLILFLTRYVSLAVLVMIGIATLWMIILVDQHLMPIEYSYYSVLVAVLIAYRFRDNIERLLRGTERRLGERA